MISAFYLVFGATMLGLAIAFGLGGESGAPVSGKALGDTKKDRDKEPQPL